MSVAQTRSRNIQFRGQDLFQSLRPDQVNTLSEAAEGVSLGQGETVYRHGDPNKYLYIVLEGRVRLTMPQSEDVSLLIDEVGEGAMFGYGACLQLETYSLTAKCVEDCRLLKISADALVAVMDRDLIMGRAIQTLISRVYYQRYLQTMNKLQAVAHSVPLA
jgi:CRP/FNR family transcriptional regulator